MSRKIFGQIGRLKQECIEEYKTLHRNDVYTEKWAGVLDMIQECNMRNYSIFIEADLVFGYFEYIGTDYEADMNKMAEDQLTQEWWSHTRPCFTKFAETSKEAFYTDMQQIFFFEGSHDK